MGISTHIFLPIEARGLVRFFGGEIDLNDCDEADCEFSWPFDCHLDKHGNCGKAGSEECEFECPYNTH